MRTILIAFTVVALALQGTAHALVQYDDEEPDPAILVEAASELLGEAEGLMEYADFLSSSGGSDLAVNGWLDSAQSSVQDAANAASMLFDMGYYGQAGNIMALAADMYREIQLRRPRQT